MNTFLVMAIFALIGIILFQFNIGEQKRRDQKYIIHKLNEIILEHSNEKLLLVTGDKELKELLITINHLLDSRQKTLVVYRKKELAMARMLSNISHDLKTPLTVVLGYIETIEIDKEISKEDRSKLLCNVHKKTLDVIGLINKFFDLAKMESEDKDIPLTRVNINEICKQSILDFHENLTSKGYEVNIDIPEKRIDVLGNIETISRIMNNLISNAINYGSEGKCLGLNLSYDDDYAYVEVWDKGKGIEETNFENVFERLYTLEDSRNKSYQGSGLGLTISRRLAEKLGGDISLKSLPYAKTSFTLKLKRMDY